MTDRPAWLDEFRMAAGMPSTRYPGYQIEEYSAEMHAARANAQQLLKLLNDGLTLWTDFAAKAKATKGSMAAQTDAKSAAEMIATLKDAIQGVKQGARWLEL